MRFPRVTFVVAFALLTSPALAQVRTFVSAATGSDANACTVASPCRNLQRGVDAVAANGEVVPLDSGGYGTLTISKAVTIAVPSGVYAGVTALTSGSSGVLIDTAGVDVKLRGLTINSLGADNGVSVGVANAMLTIERATVSGFSANGVNFDSVAGRLVIIDSVLRDSGTGVRITSSDGGLPAAATIERAHFSGSGQGGVAAGPRAHVAVRNSVAHGNFRGFQIFGEAPDFQTTLNLEGCSSTGNVVGLFSTSNSAASNYATIFASNCLIAHNTLFGIEAQGGSAIYSRVNNTVADNAGGEAFSGSFFAK